MYKSLPIADALAREGDVYRHALAYAVGTDEEIAEWGILVRVGSVESALNDLDLFELCGHSCKLCAEVGGVIHVFTPPIIRKKKNVHAPRRNKRGARP